MNQDNGTRQISQEELQKTLVLNLSDVEEVVRVEKKTSKKPAIMVGIIGLTLLLFGSGFQIITVMKERQEQERLIEQRKSEIVRTNIDCNKTKLKNSTNSDDIYSFTYHFENGKLVSATKVLTVTPSAGKTVSDIKKYRDSFKELMNTLTGYDIRISENDKGFIVTVEIDYKALNILEVDEKQSKNAVTAVDYKLYDLESSIKKDMKKREFNCK